MSPNGWVGPAGLVGLEGWMGQVAREAKEWDNTAVGGWKGGTTKPSSGVWLRVSRCVGL